MMNVSVASSHTIDFVEVHQVQTINNQAQSAVISVGLAASAKTMFGDSTLTTSVKRKVHVPFTVKLAPTVKSHVVTSDAKFTSEVVKHDWS